MPKSPKATDAAPLAWPFRRPRCVLRCLTFLGINMSIRLLAEVRSLVVLVTVLTFHFLVLGQLAFQVVGLAGRDREQVGHLGLCDIVDRFVGQRSLDDVHRYLFLPGRGVQQEFVEQVSVGSRTMGERGTLARRTEISLATAAAGRDEATWPALTRGLPDGHGGLAGDLVLNGDLVGQDVALVDPDLDPDPARRRPRLADTLVDVGPQRVQRHPALAVLLLAGHLGPAEPSRALHLDPERSGLLDRLDGPLHGPAEGHPAHQLVADALGDEGGVELGLLDLLDVELDPVLQTGDLFELLLETV